MASNISYIDNCIRTKTIPDENKVSLKLYCQYFEQRVENRYFKVELFEKGEFIVTTKAASVAHIMDIHMFYDPRFNKKPIPLRYEGSFQGIEAFRLMKKGFLTLDFLKQSNGGQGWRNNFARLRLLCFPYIRAALLYGKWYKFDLNRFKGSTKLIPDYIVNYRLNNIELNFCIQHEDNDDDNYYCVSNIIAFVNDNPRIENQEPLEINRIIEYISSDDSPINSRCHNPIFKNKLNSQRFNTKTRVDSKTHSKLIKKGCLIHSKQIGEDEFEVIYVSIDSKTATLIK